MKRYLVIMLVIICFSTACSNQDSASKDMKNEDHSQHMQPATKREVHWPVESFQFKNQDNQDFGLKDLKGKVWLADFIFSKCETVCPPMTSNLNQLQKIVKKDKIPLHFVSFSVDPVRDQPQVLKKFGKRYTEDFKSWTLLTGYSKKKIESFAKNSFKVPVSPSPDPGQFIHGTTFFLVNKQGIIVKTYSGVENPPYEEIKKDARKLGEE
ncbi:electron transport protein SCO1/SenC [Fictibacillus macauensis ZFHKF-1]|uniref:Electron transport protein SCO1/SenC n=1 Tax=Fictibacillus macauensis ZFHKF-1 TaxID=1196324 RepID=I8UFL3_9BACL|nr:SCO family protein [Fictibacillus macauensis]EIT85685.1 electron transport protein SCO1/SenC [Fictibacillus macauensis ZFHKF-1]